MQDMQAQLEKLGRDPAECALIRDLATDPKKRDLFARLAEYLTVLASAVERAIGESTGSEIAPDLPPKLGDDLRKLPLHLRKSNLERLLARRPEGIFVNPFERG